MDLGSPDKNLEEMNDIHNDDGSSVGKLDLNLAVSKEGAEVWGDKSHLDCNQQEYHGSFSLHADVGSRRLESPYIRPSSPAQFELDHDQERRKNFDHGRERLQSPPGENLVVSGRCSDKSSPVQAETFHNGLEIGDPACFSSKLLPVDFNYQQEDLENDNSPHEQLKITGHFSGKLQYEKTESSYEVMGGGGTEHLTGKSYNDNETKENIYHSGKSLSDNGKLEGRTADPHSPGRTPKRSASPVRKMSVSPERAPDMQEFAGQKPSSSPQDVPGLSNSVRSSRQKHSPSPERPGEDDKRVLSQGHLSHSARQSSTSPGRRSRKDSPHRDDSLRKRQSTSPRRRHSPPDLRRQDRSVSQSSTRQKNSNSVYGRDYRDKSRSRSPNARDHYRRSPRRRYSPRHRSPPYHSRRRSPRRRPWSPPPNRSTGLGRPGNNLFVAGFSFLTTERDLERKFSRFGRVKDVRIVRDKRSGDSRGFGFLSLERDEDADAAIRALDQTEWNGRVVLVEKSKSR